MRNIKGLLEKDVKLAINRREQPDYLPLLNDHIGVLLKMLLLLLIQLMHALFRFQDGFAGRCQHLEEILPLLVLLDLFEL